MDIKQVIFKTKTSFIVYNFHLNNTCVINKQVLDKNGMYQDVSNNTISISFDKAFKINPNRDRINTYSMTRII